jgi:hypothetical protein
VVDRVKYDTIVMADPRGRVLVPVPVEPDDAWGQENVTTSRAP